MVFRIGTLVKVRGVSVKGKITHIRWGSGDEPTKVKVQGKYWNKSSVYRVKK